MPSPAEQVTASPRPTGEAVAPHHDLRARLVVGGACAVALVIAIRGQRVVLYDDAAITFRYAARLANGHGFTLNDGDRTQGASAPLYTLVLAAASWLGADLPRTAALIGVATYTAAVGLATSLAARLAGPLAAVLAAAALLTSGNFQQQTASGMEVGLAAVLGLWALWMLARDRDVWAGVLCGLAVFNKLDAGLLVLAVAVALPLVASRRPWRFLASAAATSLPWAVFATWYFGSPIPFSFTQKLAGRAGSSPRDLTWVLRSAGTEGGVVLFLAGFALLAVVPRVRRSLPPLAAAALLAAVAWMAIHTAVYSLLDLGGTYPWYVTVVYPLEAVTAGCAGALAWRWRPPGGRVVPIAVAVVLACALGLRVRGITTTTSTIVRGHRVVQYEGLDEVRREAGRYLGHRARPGEVVETCFGWIEFGALDNPIRETCPLSTRRPVPAPTWIVTVRSGSEPVSRPPGATLRATFRTRIGDGSEADVFRVRRVPPAGGPTPDQVR